MSLLWQPAKRAPLGRCSFGPEVPTEKNLLVERMPKLPQSGTSWFTVRLDETRIETTQKVQTSFWQYVTATH